MKSLKLLTFLTLCELCLAGCGTTPYGTIGVGYQVDDNSDWYVRTDRDWQCNSNLQAHFEVGIEYQQWTLGYHHQSWWACGGPFNSKPELYQDDIRITYKIGGEK